MKHVRYKIFFKHHSLLKSVFRSIIVAISDKSVIHVYVFLYEQIGFNCTCQPGYTGDFCESEIDYCEIAGQPCQNNATCVNDKGLQDYRCECAPGMRL